MADILPNGKTQNYTGICQECKQETSVNMQGTPINKRASVKSHGKDFCWKCGKHTLDGKTIPVTFRVSKFEPKIDIDLSND